MENKDAKGFVVSFEGAYPEKKRDFLEPDSYEAVIVGVSDVFVQKNVFNNQDEGKLCVTFEVPQKTADAKTVTYFIKAKIAHSAKKEGYSDSKLYTLLEKAKLLDKCKAFWATIETTENKDVALVSWLRENLLGRDTKIVVKTIIPKEAAKYSVVSEVIRFLDVVEEEKVQ